MKYRKFKNEEVSEVGLGTWQLGSADWGNVDEEAAFSILHRFAALGGNFIDTADVYGMGVSEKTVGRFLKSAGGRFYVASKLGRRQDAQNGWPQNFSYDTMRRHLESSLTNLDLPSLFLEQLHCIPTEELRKGEVFGHLNRFKKEGLIEHWGVSVETAEEAKICLQQEGLSALQIIFNLFRQHYADDFFEEAKEKGVALIVRVPLASGLLSGKYTRDTRFSSGDHRNYNANGESFNAGETFSGIPFEQGVELAGEIADIFPDARTAQWALRWILDHPAVTTVIPGASKPEQVESNMSASSLPSLSSEQHTALASLYQTKIRPLIRGVF